MPIPSWPDESPLDLPAGTLLAGRYRLGPEIGRGGMAVVYEAQDGLLKRQVAVKIVRADALDDPQIGMRMRREARAIGSLNHPHLITFHDVAEHEGRVFIVMERLHGRTLADELRACVRLDPVRVCGIGAQIASALAAAHERGIIHRDLKPDNVFVLAGREDSVKLLDFSVAKLPRSSVDTAATTTGNVLGTPVYMAPEQAIGDPVSAAADLYALGVILFELSAGRPPFSGTSVIQILTAQSTQDAPSLADLEPDTPAELVALVGALLARQPAARPHDARAVEGLLRSLMAALQARREAPPPPPKGLAPAAARAAHGPAPLAPAAPAPAAQALAGPRAPGMRKALPQADKTADYAPADPADGGEVGSVRAPSAVYRRVSRADEAPAMTEDRPLRQTQPIASDRRRDHKRRTQPSYPRGSEDTERH